MLPSRKRTQGGASLCPGLSHFAPLGRTDREQARGQRREGTAKQPENFGAILRRYPRITMHVASRKTRGLSPGISYTIWGSFRPCQRDAGRVELHKTAFLRHKSFCVSQMQRKSSSPLRKTNQLLKHQNCRPSSTRFSHYGKNASFLKGSQYPQRTGARD